MGGRGYFYGGVHPRMLACVCLFCIMHLPFSLTHFLLLKEHSQISCFSLRSPAPHRTTTVKTAFAYPQNKIWKRDDRKEVEHCWCTHVRLCACCIWEFVKNLLYRSNIPQHIHAFRLPQTEIPSQNRCIVGYSHIYALDWMRTCKCVVGKKRGVTWRESGSGFWYHI